MRTNESGERDERNNSGQPKKNMPLNRGVLRKRYKELVPGKSRVVDISLDEDTLAIMLKMTLERRTIDDRAILIEKMQNRIELVPDLLRPYCRAIMELYERCTSHNTNTR